MVVSDVDDEVVAAAEILPVDVLTNFNILLIA